MEKFDVYGLGNALVDMEIEVNDDFLREMNIDKGQMTLVDEDRQEELLSKIPNRPRHRTCGGSAANTIIALSQLGGKGFYSCKVANDETGQFYAEDLKNNGVASNLGADRPEGKTGKCMVLITPDAERTMNSYLGITETFSITELEPHVIQESQYLYIEGYLVTSPTGREAAIYARNYAKKHNVKVALTFSDSAMVDYFREGLEQMIGDKVDLLFCNKAEALSYTQTESLELACERLKEIASCFAVTLGEQGAVVYDGAELINVSSPSVKAIDTNGAGDIFAGSFLYALSQNLGFKKAGELACQMAAELVTHFGARLTSNQIQAVKARCLS